MRWISWVLALCLGLSTAASRAESQGLELSFRLQAGQLQLEAANLATLGPDRPGLPGALPLQARLLDADGVIRWAGEALADSVPVAGDAPRWTLRLPAMPSSMLELRDAGGAVLHVQAIDRELIAAAEQRRSAALARMLPRARSAKAAPSPALQQIDGHAAQQRQRLQQHLQSAAGKGGALTAEAPDAAKDTDPALLAALQSAGYQPFAEGDQAPWITSESLELQHSARSSGLPVPIMEPSLAPTAGDALWLAAEREAEQARLLQNLHRIDPARAGDVDSELARQKDSKARTPVGLTFATEDGGRLERSVCVRAYRLLATGRQSDVLVCSQGGESLSMDLELGQEYELEQQSSYPYAMQTLRIGTVAAGQQVRITLQRGWVVRGRLSTSDGRDPGNVEFRIEISGRGFNGTAGLRRGQDYEVVVPRQSTSVQMYAFPNDSFGHVYGYLNLGISGEVTQRDILLEPAVQGMVGRVKLQQGDSLRGNEQVYCSAQRADGFRYYGGTSSSGERSVNATTGEFRIPVASSVDYDCSVTAGLPYGRQYFRGVRFGGGQPVDFEMTRGLILSGSLGTDDGQPLPALSLSLAAQDPYQYLGAVSLPAGAAWYEIAVPPNAAPRRHSLSVTPADGSGYLRFAFNLDIADSSINRDIRLTRGSLIQGQLLRSGSDPLPSNAYVNCTLQGALSDGSASSAYSAIAPDNRFQLAVVAGADYGCSVEPRGNYVGRYLRPVRFVDGQDWEVLVERAAPFAVEVVDSLTGTALADWSVSLALRGHGFTSLRPDRPSVNLPSGPWTTGVASAPGYLPSLFGPLPDPRPARQTVRLQPQRELSGTLRSNGVAQRGVRVRVLDAAEGDRFVSSLLTGGDGGFRFPLPAGRYVLEVEQPSFEASRGYVLYAPAQRSEEVVLGEGEATPVELELTALTAPELSIEVISDCSSFAEAPGLVVEVWQDDRRLARQRSFSRTTAGIGPGACASRFRSRLVPGSYQLDLHIAGAGTLRREHVQGEGAATLSLDLRGVLKVWRGRLVDAAGQPLAGSAQIYADQALDSINFASIGDDGRFAMAVNPGAVVEFQPLGSNKTLLRRRVIVGELDALPQEITLQALDFSRAEAARQGQALEPAYLPSQPRAGARRILFLGEGYVATREPFTDRNGNGLWDGIAWADLNGDGIFQRASDIATAHGSAAYPSEGMTADAIAEASEPFEDLNGDGYPNIDDPAVFDRNVRDYIRAVLGSDGWEAHRDAFEAWQVLLDSPQSGNDVLAADGETLLLERDTALGAGVSLARSLMYVDYNAAAAVANAAMPGHDILVVMVNQPVLMGRANSFILANGGMAISIGNSPVPSHEFGHKVAGLADEYDEFLGQAGTAFLNGTSNTAGGFQRELLPWGHLLPPGQTPDRVLRPGTGVFEGSSYVSGGAYRPSVNSKMRGNAPLFNEPSLRSLEAAMAPRPNATGTWYLPSEAGWGLIVVDGGETIGVSWYSYDAEGAPTWFVSALQEDGSGHWSGELLAFTGTPYTRINGPASDDSVPSIGSVRLRMPNAERLEFSYEVNGVRQGKILSRFPYGDAQLCGLAPAGEGPGESYTDFWFDPDQPGWGLSIDHRKDLLFAGWYTFGEDRKPLWFLVAPASRQADGSFRGSVYRPLAGQPFDLVDGSNETSGEEVGEAWVRFDSAQRGEFGFEIGSQRFHAPLQRLVFGARSTLCRDAQRALARP